MHDCTNFRASLVQFRTTQSSTLFCLLLSLLRWLGCLGQIDGNARAQSVTLDPYHTQYCTVFPFHGLQSYCPRRCNCCPDNWQHLGIWDRMGIVRYGLLCRCCSQDFISPGFTICYSHCSPEARGCLGLDEHEAKEFAIVVVLFV